VLLVEQNVFEALQVCHRADVLQTGRIVLEGSGSELMQSDLVRQAYLGMEYDVLKGLPWMTPKKEESKRFIWLG
jgi:ABC-type lipopolysaccharide export system ATPase subunit